MISFIIVKFLSINFLHLSFIISFTFYICKEIIVIQPSGCKGNFNKTIDLELTKFVFMASNVSVNPIRWLLTFDSEMAFFLVLSLVEGVLISF